MSSFYTTEPMPQYTNNNDIYSYCPDEKGLVYELNLVKRKKISRKNSIRKNRRRKPKLSSPIPKNLSIDSLSSLSKINSGSSGTGAGGIISSSNSSDEFSSNGGSDKDSDLESLPDLMDDTPEIDTPNTTLSSPMSMKNFMFLDNKPDNINESELDSEYDIYETTNESMDCDNGINLHNHKTFGGPSIFEIPELVYKIVEYASLQNETEQTPIRRKPDSLNHALLIHGNKEVAQNSISAGSGSSYNASYQSTLSSMSDLTFNNVMYNCLSVSKLFNQVTKEILNQRIRFDDGAKLSQFLSQTQHNIRPQEFKLSKIYQLTNSDIPWGKFNFENLTKLELFMCPKFLPPTNIFNGNLQHLIICGSKILDDNYLINAVTKCPNLKTLDIRGCEMITDSSIYNISKICKNLEIINFGRKNRGNLITDASICKLVKNNKNLNTIGLAGCHITDKSIWDIAISCNYNLKRLSLNNCKYISNQSIPLILMTDYIKNLNVLELKFTNISNFKPIIEFKRTQEFKGLPLLIELCEVLYFKMRQQEVELDKEISEKIFKDIQDWANDFNDGDSNYLSLLSRK